MNTEQQLRAIIDELFTIAAPGPLKNALWSKYQSLSSSPEESQAEKVRRYNREMDERNRIIRENVNKPWLPLQDGE